jgi:cobalt/nickel transport system permease protein
MSVEIPIGPWEYHLTLAGPVGVLLGPTGAFQAAFIASALLSFVGHGGFTVIGLNALILGLVAWTTHLIYRHRPRRWRPPTALSGATGFAQLVGGSIWAALLLAGVRAHAERAGSEPTHPVALPLLVLPLVVGGALAEALVALGFGRFLERVRPDLLGVAVGPEIEERAGAKPGSQPRVSAR